jgi:hypothetical protein
VCRAMDQNEQDTQYEAPVVEDLTVEEGPSSVSAGIITQQPPAR